MSKSRLEKKFTHLWGDMFPGLPLQTEYVACPPRRFRWDYAHPESRILIEIQGGTWGTGKHNTGTGLARDYSKMNTAVSQGWQQFNLSGDMITAEWLQLIADTITTKLAETYD